MALITIHFSSKLLETQTIVRAIVPDRPVTQPLQVIWWLHGLGDDGSTWLRKTRLELIASDYQVAIIMPDMSRSFAQNIPGGLPYFDYLNHELTEYLQSILPISKKCEDNFIVGNSMGGYSAYKWAALEPQKFSYVATLSPVTNLNTVKTFMKDYQSIIGTNPDEIPSLEQLMATQSKKLKEIKWIQYMGSDDPLKKDSEEFTSTINSKISLDLNQHILNGNHNWIFWDEQLTKIFQWLPLQKINTEVTKNERN